MLGKLFKYAGHENKNEMNKALGNCSTTSKTSDILVIWEYEEGNTEKKIDIGKKTLKIKGKN